MTTLTEKPAINQEKDYFSEEFDFTTTEGVNYPALNRIFFGYCLAVHAEFSHLSGKPKKQQASSHDWETSTPNAYVRVGEFLGHLPTRNLELLDPATLMALAKKQYEQIHEALAGERLTVIDVRGMARIINEERKAQKEEAKTISALFKNSDSPAAVEFETRYEETSRLFASQYEELGGLPPNLYVQQVNEVLAHNITALHEGLGIGSVKPQATKEMNQDDFVSEVDDATEVIDNPIIFTPDTNAEVIEQAFVTFSESLSECSLDQTCDEYLEAVEEYDGIDEEEIDYVFHEPQNCDDVQLSQLKATEDEPMVFLPASDRYKQGFEVHQVVCLNTLGSKSLEIVQFAGSSRLRIAKTFGKLEKNNQTVFLQREDGECFEGYCHINWLEDDTSIEAEIKSKLASRNPHEPYFHIVQVAQELKHVRTDYKDESQQQMYNIIGKIRRYACNHEIWFDDKKLLSDGVLKFVPGGIDFLNGWSSVESVTHVQATLF